MNDMKAKKSMKAPQAEAMKADFRPAGKHDDIVVSLDLHLMMDRGFRFSLREVPSEYFIAECEHGPSVDGGRGPAWDKNFILAMGSVAHFSIMFVNAEARKPGLGSRTQ